MRYLRIYFKKILFRKLINKDSEGLKILFECIQKKFKKEIFVFYNIFISALDIM